MSPGVRNKFGVRMFELGVFRKQMYCFEKSAYDIAVTFWPPAVIRRPRNYSHLSPSLRLWCYPRKIEKFSKNKQIFKSERHELLFHEHLRFSNTIRHGYCTDCRQGYWWHFSFLHVVFVSLLCLPHAIFRRGLVFVLLIIQLFHIQQFTFPKLDKLENNFWIVLKTASAPEMSQ